MKPSNTSRGVGLIKRSSAKAQLLRSRTSVIPFATSPSTTQLGRNRNAWLSGATRNLKKVFSSLFASARGMLTGKIGRRALLLLPASFGAYALFRGNDSHDDESFKAEASDAIDALLTSSAVETQNLLSSAPDQLLYDSLDRLRLTVNRYSAELNTSYRSMAGEVQADADALAAVIESLGEVLSRVAAAQGATNTDMLTLLGLSLFSTTGHTVHVVTKNRSWANGSSDKLFKNKSAQIIAPLVNLANELECRR